MQGISLIDLPKITDPRGNLSFIQYGPALPFDIKRCYWIYDVPGAHARRGRALRQTWEMIVPLSGSFDVKIDGERGVHLCRGDKGLLVPPMHWREIDNFSTNSVALVLASTVYDESDYIRDFTQWKHSAAEARYTASVSEGQRSGLVTVPPAGHIAPDTLEECRMMALPRHEDPDGSLTEVEHTVRYPFAVKRVFYLYDVPAGSERGGHAHHKARELIVAVSGAFTVRLTDGKRVRTFHLDRPFQALYVERGVWRTLDDFSSGAVCLVLTSEEFSEEDYIRDYDTYRDMVDASMPIPFLDLEAVNSRFMPRIAEAVCSISGRGPYIGGAEVSLLESVLADAVGVPCAVGVSNGLDALRLIFRAYIALGRLAPGDEVIVPANTYIASVLAVTDAGLTPVFVDASARTLNLDTSLLEAAVTPRTRAIMPVHLYGRVCWDAALADFAERHGLIVVEDNAQAIGAVASVPGLFGVCTAGGLGHAAGFSFYPTKNIGAMGDAGAVVTSDHELAMTVRAMANYGCDRRYHNVYAGFNCRMDPMQAAVVRAKMPHLPEINAYRREIAALYDELIVNPLVLKPEKPEAESEHVWHQYVVRVEHRDTFRAFMSANGIATDVNYPLPPMRQPCYRAMYGSVPAPVADALAARVVSLPLNTALTRAQARRIAVAVNAWDRAKIVEVFGAQSKKNR